MRNNWSRDEHILAFALYSQIPFGTIHVRNPKIKELAKLIGRSVGSVSYKLANFSRLDPFLRGRGIKGLQHGAKGEELVWKEFVEEPEALAFESERLTAEKSGKSVEELTGIETDDLPADGKERETIVRVRVNQCFFRKRVLSVYDFKCCITGLTAKPLLVASHVIPWAEDSVNRLNPKNGLCLNALHDRAFDRHLMWIDDAFKIRLSKKLYTGKAESIGTIDWLASFEGKSLLLPKNFQPDPTLLAKHASRCHP